MLTTVDLENHTTEHIQHAVSLDLNGPYQHNLYVMTAEVWFASENISMFGISLRVMIPDYKRLLMQSLRKELNLTRRRKPSFFKSVWNRIKQCLQR